MPSSSEEGSSDASDSNSDGEWTENEGASTDAEEEAPAIAAVRGRVALVTAKCPRKYAREVEVRNRKGFRLPEEMCKEDFLKAFKGIVASTCQQKLEALTCHEEHQGKRRRSTQSQEKKYLLAVKMSNNFPHQRVSSAFEAKYRMKLGFHFKLTSFGAVLGYLMNSNRKLAGALDVNPAKHPAALDIASVLVPHEAEAVAIEQAPVEEPWTENEGESTDDEEVAPADSSLRGCTALVTAACPRKYPRDIETRRASGLMIPEDFTKEVFLNNLRRTFAKQCTVKMEKATCHDEPHKRFRASKDKRERHKHVALKVSGNFAHKKVADAFQKAYGLRISFSFKLNRFVANLKYLMEPGKKPSTDLDTDPAKYPQSLDLHKELAARAHPGDAPQKESRKRKRLTFDEVSNLIIEGIGEGPLRSAKSVEAAAKALKHQGKIELWNYLGDMKTAGDVSALVAQVWRLQGEVEHPMFHITAPRRLESFSYAHLQEVAAWRNGKWRTHVLVLSGDGGLGKTSLGEALLDELCEAGYWFVDDPDDLRELNGQIQSGQGLLVDEIKLSDFKPNQIKKLFDLEKTRRIKCRHFNGTIPAGCPRIFCTNSSMESFYPKMEEQHDRTGVFRRQLFQLVQADVRVTKRPASGATAAQPDTKSAAPDWRLYLGSVCDAALLQHCHTALESVAEELGVALVSEVIEVADDMAKRAGLKPLERRRFLASLK